MSVFKHPEIISKPRNLLVWTGMATKQVSGGDIYIKKLIECSGIKFDVMLPNNAVQIMEKKALVNSYVVDHKIVNGALGLTALYIKRTFKSVIKIVGDRKKYQVAVAASPFVHDIVPVVFSRSKHKAVIFFHLIPKRKATTPSSFIRFFVARIEQKAALIIIRVFFDTILAGNEVVGSELKRRIKDKKYIIADAGIDVRKIKRPKTTKDKDLAVFVGRLTTQKGILDLVDIVSKINKSKPNFKLVVVGEGPDRGQLEDKIESSKLQSIELLGFVDDKVKYDLMHKARFFIFPSYEEGWGIALAEALYCECLSFTYEIEHYRSIFSDYPVYSQMGDSSSMAESVINNYNSVVKGGQATRMSRYDHPIVINKIAHQLAGYLE